MLNVCLLSNSRRLASTRMESGVSRSMQPSRVCSSCAAVDIFLFVLRFGFTLKSGMEASTSRIRVVFCAAVGTDDDADEDAALSGLHALPLGGGFGAVTFNRTGGVIVDRREPGADEEETVLIRSI